jgi:mannosyltransferase OCH1-like enzyme
MLWYSNKDCDNFMEKYCEKDIIYAYNILKPGAYKADLWRLCVLNKFGGVYIDAFATPFISLEKMLKGCYNKDKQFISILDCSYAGNGIHNGFIVSEKNHPFLEQAIKDIVDNVKKKKYKKSSLAITGPLALRKSIETITGKTPKEGWNMTIYPYYLFVHNFGPHQNITKDGEYIMQKYYSFLVLLHHKITKNGYSKMYTNRQVYNNPLHKKYFPYVYTKFSASLTPA